MTKQKIAVAIATGALLLNAFTPLAFADTKLEISGNGSSSENDLAVEANHSTTVVQRNKANVVNNVTSSAKTGGNNANDNTGGDTVIDTGNATSKINVSNALNKNVAKVDDCNCNGGKTDVLISGNGSYSANKADLDKNSTTDIFQNNNAYVSNYVNADAKTGDNDANRNTGGDVLVRTGHALTNVNLSTEANANIALVGSREGAGNGGNTTLRIIGNGSHSENEIDLEANRSVTLVQDNYADVRNNVYADASTGRNDAKDNTGGDVVINTGNAKAKVDVWNRLNFNAAEVGCGCDADLLAKISGNGSYSDSDIVSNNRDDLSVFQDGNDAYLSNWVDANAKTGKNDANRNTGDPSHRSDPVGVLTGAAFDDVSVSNEANANNFGPFGSFRLPGGTHVSLGWDWSDLWGSWSHS